MFAALSTERLIHVLFWNTTTKNATIDSSMILILMPSRMDEI